MEILDHYLGYEAWTLRHIIARCRELSTDQLRERFDIGHGSAHDTVTHTIRNVEAWTDVLRQRAQREFPPMPENADAYLQRFDAAMADFGECARACRCGPSR